MSELTLNAEVRTVLGKKVAQLRRNGLIPGVVYGPVVPETVQVSVNRREFDRFYRAHGHSTLFTLTWTGGTRPVFIREVQEDPVRREPLHIDFFAPNMLQTLRTMVQVVFHSPAEHIEGVLTELRTEVEVEALPANVPHQIDVDISSLAAAGDAVHVSDLSVPDGVTIVTGEDEILAHVTAARVEEEPEETEAEAADADAEEGTEASAGDETENE
ncbi:MAG: 50S ribosomal protein L25 [Chloroflexia bacterium]|nr:50S ribosomal protein L25 [Chloroflexia bacterium]MDQ3412033.1 50S ribosomal protein L25 [Chloroflexota bacterium]